MTTLEVRQAELEERMLDLERNHAWTELDDLSSELVGLYPEWFPAFTYRQAARAEIAAHWADCFRQDPHNVGYARQLLEAIEKLVEANRQVRKLADELGL